MPVSVSGSRTPSSSAPLWPASVAPGGRPAASVAPGGRPAASVAPGGRPAVSAAAVAWLGAAVAASAVAERNQSWVHVQGLEVLTWDTGNGTVAVAGVQTLENRSRKWTMDKLCFPYPPQVLFQLLSSNACSLVPRQ